MTEVYSEGGLGRQRLLSGSCCCGGKCLVGAELIISSDYDACVCSVLLMLLLASTSAFVGNVIVLSHVSCLGTFVLVPVL